MQIKVDRYFFSYDMTLTNACIELANKWINSSLVEIDSFSNSDIEKLNGFQKKTFLNLLLESVCFPVFLNIVLQSINVGV